MLLGTKVEGVGMGSVEKPPRWFLLFALICALVSGFCFYPGLSGKFIFDDMANIVKNGSLHVTVLTLDSLLYAAYSFQPGHGSRALSMLSFALDYWRGGLDPAVFKATNLVIHGLTTFALALLFRQLLVLVQWPPRRAAAGALVLALLWAIHPLQVSTVLYVVQRMQMLVTLFMVLALWAYLRMRQAQMEGRRSRQYGVLAVLFWVLGFAGKEDAALLPAYTLALEFTVLRFRAARPPLARMLRNGYLVLSVAGLMLYLLVVVPHYWHWEAYPGREFSSYERLLTQGRVLVMYMGQILLPLPRLLPFYYDNLTISRGWLQPSTTLLAWLLVLGLLAWTWCWRSRRPLFAFGVLLFFAGHFMTSNVINLELAFEHRNHLPLIGMVLAVADLCMAAWHRMALRWPLGGAFVAVMLLVLGATTVWRAHVWGDPLRLASAILKAAPDSERAWVMLSGVYVDRGGFAMGPDLDRAIVISEQGAEVVQDSALLLSNAVIYKTIKGTVSRQDWDGFLQRLRQAPMNAQNRRIIWTFLYNIDRKIPMDEEGVLQTIEITAGRVTFTPNQYLQLGAYIHNQTLEPEKALFYLRRAVELSPSDDPEIEKMLHQLAELGSQEWVRELERVRQLQTQASEISVTN